MSSEVTFDRGTTLGSRYELFEEIGEGSFGRIFRARQLDVGRDVAIKILPPQFSNRDNVVERFRREARLASRLRHPNTITIYEYGRHDDLFFIAMEYLRGQDLADRLATHRTLELSTAVHIAQQTLHSLREAHKLGIVHRDLKPENIFLTELAGDQNFVKVLDFGIAKLASHHPQTASEEGRALTIQGNTVGTPIYMSPEQAAGEDVDAASDIYALGVILFEMINGTPPFMRDRPVRTMRAHLFDPVPDFTRESLRNTVFESIVTKALAKEPDDRWTDAEAFLEALDGKDLQSTLSDDGDGAGADEDLDDPDTIPFNSIDSPNPSDASPPPEGFSRDDGSATSSIITVLDEPSDDDVIVLTKKKEPPLQTESQPESQKGSSGFESSDYIPNGDIGSPRQKAKTPDERQLSADDGVASPSEDSSDRGDWKWNDDIPAADASGSQILTDYEPAGSRRWALALAALLVIAATIIVALAMGWIALPL